MENYHLLMKEHFKRAKGESHRSLKAQLQKSQCHLCHVVLSKKSQSQPDSRAGEVDPPFNECGTEFVDIFHL